MHHASRQHADGFQFLSLKTLLFKLGAFGFRFLAGGNIVNEAFVIADAAGGMAHDAGTFGDPNDSAIAPPDLIFQAADKAGQLDFPPELFPQCGIDIKLVLNVGDLV